MGNILDKIELNIKSEARKRLRDFAPKARYAFLLAIFLTPVAAIEIVSIPFFGLGVVILACYLTVLYFYRTSAKLASLAAILGIVVGFYLITYIPILLKSRMDLPLFGFYALSNLVMLSYLVFISCALWRAYHKATPS
jgi:hypothetical protein